MKKTLIWIASVIGAAAVITVTLQYISKSVQPHVIHASGECLTNVTKDRTAITLLVQTLDKNAAVSMKMASTKISEITNFLKTQDVQIQTVRFDSYTKTQWDNISQKSIELGVETNIAIEVSAKKHELIESVLSKFSGQANIFSENLRMFTSAETMKAAVEKCLGDAVANAKERATAMISKDNKKLGAMISAEYIKTSMDNDIRPMNFMARAKAESSDISAGLVSKDTEISVTVNATFEIK